MITTRRGFFGLLPALSARKGRKVTPEYPVVSNTGLLVPAINSPNFNLQNPTASPSPSWAILQNGLAYFFGLILSGGTITGPDYIINPTGIFFYTGTPGAGNPPVAWVSTGTVDPFGNALLAAAQIGAEELFAGSLVLSGGGTIEGITGTGAVEINANGGGVQVLGTLEVETNGGFGGNPVLSATTVGNVTNANLAGAQPITASYFIGVNDPQVGTVYEIQVDFDGTIEAQTITWGISIDGNAPIAQTSVGAGFLPGGTVFEGSLRARVKIQTTGAAGTFDAFTEGAFGTTATRSSGANGNSGPIGARAIGGSINTTISHTIEITAAFGAAAAGQTITGYGSTITRSGP